ncbi:LysR family transcriptional regulator [Natronospirillum operosum]|uniref:LysR family transcriptional regulator n=1 Tax=Natronospirillum operosum TaxID=2759953 RepID=A0A4Z0WBA9_9GAMM|nr:LysR substrate-binding domain-containing protein [Natronospirillum operosum]TGG91786.1 LysR family transcriptional regulator [Natronospirillum operosum]
MIKHAAPALDLQLLRTFQSVAQLGSLAAAAEQQHRTLGAISLQIKRLEERLDTRLLERGPRGVRLTASGESLLQASRELLRQHDTLMDRFTGRGLAGRVRLGVPEDYASELMTGILPLFLERHPGVQLEVVTGTSGHLAREIEKGRLTLSVLLDRPHPLPGGVPLWETTPVWAAARISSLEDRESLPLALHETDCPYRQLAIEALEEADMNWHVVFTSTSINAIEDAVAAGLAIGVIDQERLKPTMRELTAEDGLPPLKPGQAGLHRAARIEPAARDAADALANLLTEQLTDRGPWRHGG